jgi:hypothetical protein
MSYDSVIVRVIEWIEPKFGFQIEEDLRIIQIDSRNPEDPEMTS